MAYPHLKGKNFLFSYSIVCQIFYYDVPLNASIILINVCFVSCHCRWKYGFKTIGTNVSGRRRRKLWLNRINTIRYVDFIFSFVSLPFTSWNVYLVIASFYSFDCLIKFKKHKPMSDFHCHYGARSELFHNYFDVRNGSLFTLFTKSLFRN